MTRNSIKQMVSVLKQFGPMTENEITQTAFNYDRNYHGTVMGESNKKYADMLRRGITKGIIDRVEIPSNAINLTRINTKPTRAKFIYFATKEIQVPCSAELDMQMANESENIQ